jgi:hypothetical protein
MREFVGGGVGANRSIFHRFRLHLARTLLRWQQQSTQRKLLLIVTISMATLMIFYMYNMASEPQLVDFEDDSDEDQRTSGGA